jgi:hypothetical protein
MSYRSLRMARGIREKHWAAGPQANSQTACPEDRPRGVSILFGHIRGRNRVDVEGVSSAV